MSSPDGHSFTRLLRRVDVGDPAAAAELFRRVYDELRRIAHTRMRSQPHEHLLQSTALVNEALLRLHGKPLSRVTDRMHFMRFAAKAMRHVLVEYARRGQTEKRRPPGQRTPLEQLYEEYSANAVDLVALDSVLTRLEEIDPLAHEIVHQRFFNGLGMQEVAELLGVSLRTAERRWESARKFIYGQLTQ